MRKPNSISTAPRDKFKFRNPVKFGHRFIAFLPVAVQTNHFRILIVNHQDVWSHLPLGVLVIIQFQVGVNVVNPADSVFVVA